ncbi:response regulator transcription factor [Actinomycetospora straminea]|uniref:response regulator transcription factor n=1 Tax=Actinomycetospora straminea TaxID=663607 RepID=UPI002366CFDB|nr:LuxR C-terminal-related transcriptional regulator [Actinomycetospora straminea]MDD7933741.1 LuxR C-terminal-related transcriptional regulator [Actinomycetospora straminea]
MAGSLRLAKSASRSLRNRSTLTRREVAVLSLLADGFTAARIARTLSVSERTVHKHLEHIYAKLTVSDRLSAVLVAQELGLLDSTPPLSCGDTV